ncbi:MAG: SOS response-associated peptidase [Nitratireductor sp.]|uniref:SOS response-associated peptidase n=1 Tax=Nitratireductor sp. TaxID=1872084 RepID=UPI0026281BEB|nr:SOS response-associated peptidase [Nitratireductor sp.]MCV0348437.1 SOS response-associated peptidase [Nitratireductor sp.]
MCNLYNMTTTRQAIRDFIKTTREYAFNEPSLQIYPNRYAPIIRMGEDGEREMVRARWGMPTPPMFIKGKHDSGVTNIRNTSSAHWRKWLSPQSRCLVPVTSFAEPDPASKQQGDKRTPNAWFALNDERSLFVFAGLWTPWHGKRMAREEPADHEVYGFLTTEPNRVVEPVHKKAMPVILTTEDEMTAWLTEPWEEAKKLQRPLPDEKLMIVEAPEVPD